MGFALGQPSGPSNTTETRRKHRWVFQTIEGGPESRVLLLLQKAQRPHFKFDEVELHHNQEVAWFAGKQQWDPITLSFYDAVNPDSTQAVYDWLQKVVTLESAVVADPADYKKNGTLKITSSANAEAESWVIDSCWPQDINWNELDYTSSDILLIDVLMRYDRATIA